MSNENSIKPLILNSYEIENIEGMIIGLEKSFGFEFEQNDLSYIKTVGDLVDITKGKINLDRTNDCTSQQAFYKLRKALNETLDSNNIVFLPSTRLENIIVNKQRKEVVLQVEKELGFKLNLLGASKFIINIYMILILISIVFLFIDWKIGLFGIVFSHLLIWLGDKLGNTFKLDTLGEVAHSMKYSNYLFSRRNANSVNESELDEMIINWFSNCVDDAFVDRNTRLV